MQTDRERGIKRVCDEQSDDIVLQRVGNGARKFLKSLAKRKNNRALHQRGPEIRPPSRK